MWWFSERISHIKGYILYISIVPQDFYYSMSYKICCKTCSKKQYNKPWQLIPSYPIKFKYLRLNHEETISDKRENPFIGIVPQQELVCRGSLLQSLTFSWAENKNYFCESFWRFHSASGTPKWNNVWKKWQKLEKAVQGPRFSHIVSPDNGRGSL